MDLFDRLLDSADPNSLLEAEYDPEVRTAAERLWRHHLSAANEGFLEQTVDFAVLPVFQPLQVLLERFEIERLLGRGGMGEVYLARDRTLGEPVALKTIARLLASSRQIRRRFVAEVQNARRITHPNVCRIHELFDQAEAVFFAMEYIEGTPLDEMTRSGALSPNSARELCVQLAEGLDAAHRNGVVHGDFKPSNVLVAAGRPPRAVIMDFGLARAMRGAPDDPAGTESLAAGTLDYMAPELLAGSPPSVASDLFAFGKVARQLLPRERLWDACIRDHPGERPASLAPIIRRLRRDTSRRYWIGSAAVAVAAFPLYSILHPPKPPIRIEAGARILVNGFEAAETALAGARLARSLLITGLQQSPVLRAIADQDVLPTLRRLSPGKGFPAQGDVLRRLLEVHKATHWIDGVWTEASDRISVALRVWSVKDQRLHAETEIGDAPAAAAVAEQTGLWVRQLAGESERSLAAYPVAITSYTSAVPEALQKYYEAMEHYSLAQMELAIPLLEEAIALDREFAQAHNVLAMCLNSEARYVDALQASERARSLSAKLPMREKAWIEAFYQELVRDPDKMTAATQANLDARPDEPRFYRVHTQALCMAGRPEEAIPVIRKASAELAPQDEFLREELILTTAECGKFEEARALADQAQKNNPERHLHRGLGLALLGLGLYDEAYREFERVSGESRLLQAGARILAGDAESAIVALRQELAAHPSPDAAPAAHRALEFLCGTYFLTDRLELAASSLRAMAPLPECPILAQRWDCTAFWAARIGDDQTLAAAAAQLRHIADRWQNRFTHGLAAHAAALQFWRRRQMREAEASLLDSMGSAFSVWTLFDLADFFAATGRPELAEEYWLKFEQRHGTILRRWFPGAILYGWLNRALSARQRGDKQTASVCASKILLHWAPRHPRIRMVQKAAELAAS